MNNPFDNAYDAVLRQDEASRNRDLQKQTDSGVQQQYARGRVEPYLLNVAPAVLRRLTELGINPITDSVSSQAWPAPAPRTKVPYWPLQATFGPDGKITALHGTQLCMTAEGFFVLNPTLTGHQGFAELLETVYVIRQRPSYNDVRRLAPVCVEDGTDRVCVATHGYDDVIMTEFSDHVAEHVRLLHRAAQLGPIWNQ
ncbi:hypothetical protein B1A87_006965 [Arthrobacter sp. KBS0703]|uniref:hypothetical protein n=1 Tax=Arthrobacter sp. KBS0703 TaxID=1955698 RepID=UPI0009C94F10|nr:hypothetical protein [Arthrobacter sp. KBS0703]TSE15680.1 hypothetical protein B1A87_006965 [Arthrobacter sp. KBS0703]